MKQIASKEERKRQKQGTKRTQKDKTRKKKERKKQERETEKDKVKKGGRQKKAKEKQREILKNRQKCPFLRGKQGFLLKTKETNKN